THPFRVLPEEILYLAEFLLVILHHGGSVEYNPYWGVMWAKSTFIVAVDYSCTSPINKMFINKNSKGFNIKKGYLN
ncbi:MAG: hypothetical protein WCB35_07790, partial [Methanoregula sp.]|uniref:hypothetical protein n=1 Tax=Methanoregula sp. TaxID=2052170 RepID=UPI003C779963